ncbi:MAG TPA: DUF1924 domain-containing protein [Gallionella sp.]|jgi:hypothetical protein|nr:DUF1924 domain-containing protein [Gallionella sp.]
MKRAFAITAVGVISMILTPSCFAGPREELLTGYAAAAKSSEPSFAGFSATRGQTLHTKAFAGGKADTPACTSCHGKGPNDTGHTLTGKAIEAMAASVTPSRYTDPAKVEKWFRRNCNEVLGRECSAQEKGDWLTYMISQ